LRFPGALGSPTSVYHSLRLLACGYPRWPIAARLLGACQLLSDAVSVNHILASQTATNHPDRNHRRSLALNDSRLQQGLAGYLRPKPSSLQSLQHWLTSTPSFQRTHTSFSRSTAVAQSSTKFEFSVPRLRRTVKTWAFWSNCTSHSLHAHTAYEEAGPNAPIDIVNATYHLVQPHAHWLSLFASSTLASG
jgi:hypothetical protein